jgi:hypothetical protein
MRNIAVAVSLVLVIFVLAACLASKPQNEIRTIDYRSDGLGATFEYRVNMADNSYWTWVYAVLVDETEERPRDTAADNDGFRFVRNFSEAEAQTFLTTIEEEQLLQWEGSYYNPDVVCGEYWKITITFNDGTAKNISGGDNYPASYDKVINAIRALSGK